LKTKLSNKYLFLIDEDSSQEKKIDENLIFNDIRYISLWPGDLRSFYLKNNHSGKIAGICRFYCENYIARSPYKAPFASIFLFEDIEFSIIRSFIRLIVKYLKQQKIKKIYLKHYPNFYSFLNAEKLLTALLFERFEITKTDINHYLKISDNTFESSVHHMQRRRINKCIRLNYNFTVHSNNEIKYLFKKICEFRRQKNIPVNITPREIEKLASMFPDHYKFFSISDKERIIATTCIVKVNSETLYNFLPASDEEYKTSSPMVFLIKNIYEYAQKNHFQFLDLGISSINNRPQYTLINFKERIGGITGVKFTFEKNV